MLPHLIEQPKHDTETSDHKHSVFVPEGGNIAAQPSQDDESIIPSNVPE